MVPKNRHRFTAADASMVSERQLVDELAEVGNDPEEEVNPLD